MKKNFLIATALILVAAILTTTNNLVSAAPLPSKTITQCPSFEELQSFVLINRIVNFELSKACTVTFKEEIVLNGYAVIRNVGVGILTFDGNGNDGDENNDSSFFSVNSSGLELYNVTLANGKSVNGGALSIHGGNVILDHVTLKNNTATGAGGAIYFSTGDVEIRNSSFIGNATMGDPMSSSGSGGAIYASNFGMNSRILILDSTFASNKTGDSQIESSGRGGAIYVYDVQGVMMVNIFNSTFYRNSTGASTLANVGDGGAIYANNYDGTASLNIYHSTFSENATGSTWTGFPGDGQTIYLREASLNMAGTIMGNSISSYGAPGKDCDHRGDVSINDGGYNIIENMGDCRDYFSRGSEKDPGLQTTLMNNGGATQTLALQTTSSAVDQIPIGAMAFGISLCGYDFADNDQRGESRPGNTNCDIGAYEIVDAAHPYTLPATGFPEGQVTQLIGPMVEYQVLTVQDSGMQLVIPILGVKAEIVGVPELETGWNVEWLGDQVGYLNGTSFPTWVGNTVLTGHAYNHQGKKSVFAELNLLKYNDLISIQAWGQEYLFAVQDHYVTFSDDFTVLAHSDLNQLTLITCTGYDPIAMTYPLREVVVAILVEVR